VVRLALALALVVGLAGACALITRDPPDNVCRGDEDCFRAQGEVCNTDTKRCEPGPDAGVDASPAELIDAGVDSQ
jgi:hypothetical protein